MRKLALVLAMAFILVNTEFLCAAGQDGWQGPKEPESSFPLWATLITSVGIIALVLLGFRDSVRSQRKKDVVNV